QVPPLPGKAPPAKANGAAGGLATETAVIFPPPPLVSVNVVLNVWPTRKRPKSTAAAGATASALGSLFFTTVLDLLLQPVANATMTPKRTNLWSRCISAFYPTPL